VRLAEEASLRTFNFVARMDRARKVLLMLQRQFTDENKNEAYAGPEVRATEISCVSPSDSKEARGNETELPVSKTGRSDGVAPRSRQVRRFLSYICMRETATVYTGACTNMKVNACKKLCTGCELKFNLVD
jgi:hypothetical protein